MNPDNLSIEHVLPQAVENDEAGRSWQAALGATTWPQEHEKWVHTLGNLTLTGTNPELGNNTFAMKQAMFAQSNVSLNAYFGGVSRWIGADIKQRAVVLGRVTTRLWPRPEGQPYVPKTPDPEELFDETFEQANPVPRQETFTHGRLHVVIHWSILGFNEPDEIIHENQDGLTHAKFIGRLIAMFGSSMSEKLQQIPVARGDSFALSENPERDFFNHRAGRPYAHKPVPNTRLFLFTNTDNPRKKDDILQLCRRLGFSPGGVEVT